MLGEVTYISKDFECLLQQKKLEWIKSLSDKFGFEIEDAMSHISDLENKKVNIKKKRCQEIDDRGHDTRNLVTGVIEKDFVSHDLVVGQRVEKNGEDDFIILLQM